MLASLLLATAAGTHLRARLQDHPPVIGRQAQLRKEARGEGEREGGVEGGREGVRE